MAVIHIKFEDSDQGVQVGFTSNRELPEDANEWSSAELLAKQTVDSIDTLMSILNEEKQL